MLTEASLALEQRRFNVVIYFGCNERTQWRDILERLYSMHKRISVTPVVGETLRFEYEHTSPVCPSRRITLGLGGSAFVTRDFSGFCVESPSTGGVEVSIVICMTSLPVCHAIWA
jgi:hypothetical protein